LPVSSRSNEWNHGLHPAVGFFICDNAIRSSLPWRIWPSTYGYSAANWCRRDGPDWADRADRADWQDGPDWPDWFAGGNVHCDRQHGADRPAGGNVHCDRQHGADRIQRHRRRAWNNREYWIYRNHRSNRCSRTISRWRRYFWKYRRKPLNGFKLVCDGRLQLLLYTGIHRQRSSKYTGWPGGPCRSWRSSAYCAAILWYWNKSKCRWLTSGCGYGPVSLPIPQYYYAWQFNWVWFIFRIFA
jgi:hypothetical protein